MLKARFICVLLLAAADSCSWDGHVSYPDCNNFTHTDITPQIPLQRFRNSYYYFGLVYLGNYFQATQFCNLHNMALLSIESKEENDFLLQYIHTYDPVGHRFWTSGTILPDDKTWVWMSTGKHITYTNWKLDQPDFFNQKEKCIEILYTNSTPSLLWNDITCEDKNQLVICEARAVRNCCSSSPCNNPCH